MPGDNCSVYGCGKSRRTEGIGIFKLPNRPSKPYQEWRTTWLNELTKHRQIDADFKRQIDEDRVHTCEEHFHPHEIEVCKYFPILLDITFYL